jgi:hypothetical protein
MPFGIPGSDTTTESGPFLGRLQFDARSGFFTNVDRVQDAGGNWTNRASDPYRGPNFAADFGSFEIGYIKLASPPAFLLVPMGQPIPPQPQEMAEAKPGERARKAFSPGFRLKVMSQKTFGDADPRHFAGTSKSLMGAMEDLYSAFLAAPEARAGKIPLVTVASTKTIETTTPKGTTKNYAPVFAITGWIDRPAGFGDRTVPAPSGVAFPPQPAAPVPAPHVAAAALPPSVAADPLPF